MAYLLLTISVVFTLGWLIGLLFTLKSVGPRNPIIPGLAVFGFAALGWVAMDAAMDAIDNPPKLQAKIYDSIKDGMSVEHVQNLLGPPMKKCPPLTENDKGGYVHPGQDCPDNLEFLTQLDLAGNGVSLPTNITSRLRPDADSASAIDAKLVINLEGVPGPRNAKEGLGASANEMNGLVGLVIILNDGSGPSSFSEGEGLDWIYEDNDTAEAVAKKLSMAIDAHASWSANSDSDEFPNRVVITSKLPSMTGERGNVMTGRAAIEGTNAAVRVGYANDGASVNFRGGQDSVALEYWLEKDGALDGNFTMSDRLVVVGYVDNKVHSLKQAGLGETLRGLSVSLVQINKRLKDLEPKFEKLEASPVPTDTKRKADHEKTVSGIRDEIKTLKEKKLTTETKLGSWQRTTG